MSGPSLRKQDAHSSIHESALNEAIELRELIQKCLDDGKKEKALQVIEVAIDHWESRTLKHAEAEEEGLYKDIVKEDPELQNTVIQLTRDHDLMRRIVGNMKERLQTHEPDQQMITLLDSLVIIEKENFTRLSRRLAYAINRILSNLPSSNPYFKAIELLMMYVFMAPGKEEIALLENEHEEAIWKNYPTL